MTESEKSLSSSSSSSLSSSSSPPATATRRQRRQWRRRRSVRSGRGPVHQVGPGQPVAVYVIIGLFNVPVCRFRRTVGRGYRLVGDLCDGGKRKKQEKYKLLSIRTSKRGKTTTVKRFVIIVFVLFFSLFVDDFSREGGGINGVRQTRQTSGSNR